jgi:chromate reductase
MFQVTILLASVRTGRMSHRVALFFQSFLESNHIASVTMADLAAYRFPVFEERLSHIAEPTESMKVFAGSIKNADGIIIVTPEYNGGYPASLKNAIDLLYPEWKRKPVALAAVSNGAYAGSQVLTSLSFSLMKIGATLVPSMYRVGNVQDIYDENGVATDPKVQKFARGFIDDLAWYMEAKKRMEAPPAGNKS